MRALALVSVAVVVAVVWAGCGGARARAPEPPPPPEAVSGLWELADGSNIVMQIALISGVPQIDAWTLAQAGETEAHFEVSDISWDGRRLQATFSYPPTKTTTRSDLVLVNTDRLEGTVSGAYAGRETWVRAPPAVLTGKAVEAGEGKP